MEWNNFTKLSLFSFFDALLSNAKKASHLFEVKLD